MANRSSEYVLCCFADFSINLSVNFQFYENGIAVIENFLDENEVAELNEAAVDLCKNAPEEDRRVFHASAVDSKATQLADNYFLQSSNKVHYFYETDALDEHGNLQVEPTKALNKVNK